DLGAAKMRGQPLGEIERRRSSHIVLEMAVHLVPERGIGLGLGVRLLEIEDDRHQRLGDEAAAIETEVSAIVRAGPEGVGLLNGHAVLATLLSAAARAARTKARTFSGSLSPGDRSTPEDTSTDGAPVMRSASATLAGSSPPESMNGTPASMPA